MTSQRFFFVVLVLALVTACASPPVTPPRPAGTPFRGEVWTWDEQRNTVTLRQGAETVRIRVTPEQIAGLRPYQVTTVYGEIDPPVEIERIMIPAPTAFVPSGPAAESEVTATVARIDPAGRVALSSPRGPLEVWAARPGASLFKTGEAVRVRMSVQPLSPVPPGASPPDARVPATLAPAVSPGAGPGEYAAVIGRVLAVDPAGRITVESPRGPIILLVPDAGRYRVGDHVEVHTAIQPG